VLLGTKFETTARLQRSFVNDCAEAIAADSKMLNVTNSTLNVLFTLSSGPEFLIAAVPGDELKVPRWCEYLNARSLLPRCNLSHLPKLGISSINFLMTKDLFVRRWEQSVRFRRTIRGRKDWWSC